MDIVKLQDMTVKKDHMIMDIHQVTLITMDSSRVLLLAALSCIIIPSSSRSMAM